MVKFGFDQNDMLHAIKTTGDLMQSKDDMFQMDYGYCVNSWEKKAYAYANFNEKTSSKSKDDERYAYETKLGPLP